MNHQQQAMELDDRQLASELRKINANLAVFASNEWRRQRGIIMEAALRFESGQRRPSP